MQLQRQHSLLSYLKTLSVGPAEDELTTSRVTAQLNQLSHQCAVKRFHQSALFFVFSFSLLCLNSSIYSSSTISKRDAIVAEKQQAKLRKKYSLRWPISISVMLLNALLFQILEASGIKIFCQSFLGNCIMTILWACFAALTKNCIQCCHSPAFKFSQKAATVVTYVSHHFRHSHCLSGSRMRQYAAWRPYSCIYK